PTLGRLVTSVDPLAAKHKGGGGNDRSIERGTGDRVRASSQNRPRIRFHLIASYASAPSSVAPSALSAEPRLGVPEPALAFAGGSWDGQGLRQPWRSKDPGRASHPGRPAGANGPRSPVRRACAFASR